MKYTERCTGKKVRMVGYIDQDLQRYAKLYCKANAISESRLISDLLRWLRDEA